jgi:CheY-like chemotaxis protein
MFEPFFTTKGVGKGTGLGLATVYGIVAHSGGCITVHSAPGRGTTFAIDVPRAAGGPAAAQIQESAGASRGSETILLVEDEDFLRDLARRMLEMAGYAVITAADGDRALSLLDGCDRPVDLVLTDVVMPGMSGRERAAKVADRAAPVKVLYTSGYTEDVILRKGLADQRMHFLRKPYSMAELTRAVRNVLDS